MPRARRDLARCLEFIATHPWGDPAARLRDIELGIETLRTRPMSNAVRSRRRVARLEYRRHNVAQFVIVYAYFVPCAAFPRGLISIRAIRHANEEDVFCGVRDSAATHWPQILTTKA